MDQKKQIQFLVRPPIPPSISLISQWADDTWWTWNPKAHQLFRMIDPELWWKIKHAPKVFLSSVSYKRLNEMTTNAPFLSLYNSLVEEYSQVRRREAIPLEPDNPLRHCVAYFSLEFGLHESVALYSGGLGVLAGDHLKSASDLEIPLVGVSLFYGRGYFNQHIDSNGWQIEEYVPNDFDSIPIEAVMDGSGKQIKINIPLWGTTLWASLWLLRVGNVPLYLLNSNVPENTEQMRRVCDQLYVGDRETRFFQEILLGVGGYRALVRMNYLPQICHMNEGHSAFLSFARIEHLQSYYQLSLPEAIELNRQTNVFTTHTPVPAGNEVFSLDLARPHLHAVLSGSELDVEQIIHWSDGGSPDLSMTILGLQSAVSRNGVSQIHGDTSRKMWQHIWPKLTVDEVPIGAITNGVHPLSWLSQYHLELYNTYLERDWTKKSSWSPEELAKVDRIPDFNLLKAHQRAKLLLLDQVQLITNRRSPKREKSSSHFPSEHTLTIGFARRFAAYKRANLILQDPDRLERIIRNEERPVQFIFAGKAHPADNPGKHIIQSLIEFARERDLEHTFFFLDNYDIRIARLLVQGVDVWLNNPVRPEEASGTSGMKAAINGVPNFSILDGWWAEGYHQDCGWEIPTSQNSDPWLRDAEEAHSLYYLLESRIAPSYYFNDNNLQSVWVRYMKNAIKRSLFQFSSHRMVAEYNRKYYLPGRKNFDRLTSDSAAGIRALNTQKENILEKIQRIDIHRPVFLNVEVPGEDHLPVFTRGETVSVEVKIDTAGLRDEDLSVELKICNSEWASSRYSNISGMKLDRYEGKLAVYQCRIECGDSGYSQLTVRVAPRDRSLRDMSPGYLVYYNSRSE